MKKWLLLAVAGMLVFSSCSKDMTNILGKWIYDTSADTYQYEFSAKYKRFCMERDSLATFDEEVHNLDYVYYGYWKFQLSQQLGSIYYLRMDGSTYSYENFTYYIIDGVLYNGSLAYDIVSLDKKQLVVQQKDTTYFYDEYYEKQIAWVKTDTYVLNKED